MKSLVLVGVLVVAVTTPGCTAARPHAPEVEARGLTSGSLQLLVQGAVARLQDCGAATQRCAILLQARQGARAQDTQRLLRDTLANEPRFVWTSATRADEEPVPDESKPGDHVHGVSWHFDPPPQLVLVISEYEGRAHVSARDPGPDPLGPPDAGWLWTLHE